MVAGPGDHGVVGQRGQSSDSFGEGACSCGFSTGGDFAPLGDISGGLLIVTIGYGYCCLIVSRGRGCC